MAAIKHRNYQQTTSSIKQLVDSNGNILSSAMTLFSSIREISVCNVLSRPVKSLMFRTRTELREFCIIFHVSGSAGNCLFRAKNTLTVS